MEEDQEPKHMCKLCNKSFPCGRSLGGHMRSHVIYPSDHQQKFNIKKKLSSVNNGGNINAFIDAGYGLRENPKKTCKFKDSSEDTLLTDKLCKECGKAFQSWKALFGHMKCHSDKITQTRVDEQDSWTTADQSDNETTAPNRKKRSSRKVKRYNNMVTTATTASSSLPFNANASLSVSEIEQEQEEVAMCLIMLSKDVSHWGGLDSIGDSSDNNSEFLKAKNLVTNGGEIVKFKKLRNGKLESTTLDTETEFGASGNLMDGSNMKKSETQFAGQIVDVKLKKSKVVEELDFQVPEVGMRKNLIKETESDQKAELGTKKHHSSKRKVLDLFDPELGVNYSEIYKEKFEKKSKFECASCNKVFHSYQALGGHRASHKKLKGCFGFKIDGCENNSIGTDQNLSSNPSTADDTSPNIDHEVVADTNFGTKKINRVGSHECPICFRVFSSGQALGGHKRSHLIAEAKNNQSSIVVQKPIPEIRDFLDLNLPAPVEEEEESSISGLGFNPWWIGSSHRHETLLGLLSN